MGFGQGHISFICMVPGCENRAESSVGFENFYCDDCLAVLEQYYKQQEEGHEDAE